MEASTSVTAEDESFHCSSIQLSTQRRKRQRQRYTSCSTALSTRGYLRVLHVLCYTIVMRDGINSAAKNSTVTGMMNGWKRSSNATNFSAGTNNPSMYSNRSSDPNRGVLHHHDPSEQQQHAKDRFLSWIRNRQRQKRVESGRQYHVPTIDDPRLTYHLHPTPILSVASERRKLLLPQLQPHNDFNTSRSNIVNDDNDSDHYYRQWFAPEETSAVYATIPDQYDPKHRGNRQLADFYALRHLSRHEQQYRISNNYSLQFNWNGLYDTTFFHQIVHFDDDLFLEMRDKYSGSSNVTDTEHNEMSSQKYKYSRNDHNNDFVSKARRYRRRHEYNRTHQTFRQLNQRGRRLSSTSSVDNHITYAGGIYNNYQSVPLSQGYGTHFANVWVGTPVPQRKTVIVDTGSHYTAFPCTGCKDCGAPHHTDPYYRPENSKTFQQLQCNDCQDDVPCEDSKW